MTLFKTPKLSFLAGEVAPMVSSAIESDKYLQGLNKCENWMVDVLDGIKNRPGLQYISNAYNTAQKSRFIPFQFNEEQAYMLEFANERMRVIKDGGMVVRDIVDAAYKWTLSGSGTAEYYMELAAGGDPSMFEPSRVLENGAYSTKGTAGSLAAGEWDYGDNDALGWNTPYKRLLDDTDPDTKAQGYVQAEFMLSTPHALADSSIYDMTYTQSADTLYLFHGDYKPVKVTRTADDAWTDTSITDIDGPYQPRELGDENTTVQIVYSGSGQIWNVTASSTIFADVASGEPIRFGFVKPGDGSELHWNYFTVNSYVSDTSITIDDLGNEIGYEHMDNWDFSIGTEFWQDKSDDNSTLTYDMTNRRALLTDGATGFARMMQGVLVKPGTNYRLITDFADIDGSSYVRIGTTVLGDELYNSGALGPGAVIDTADFNTDTAELIYITINTNGSTDTDVSEVNDVSLKEYEIGAANPKFTTNEWRLAEFNSTRGFPKYGIINNQRLILAGTDAKPQGTWASELGNFEGFGFTTPGRSSDSFSFQPATETINGIRWIIEKDGLKVGTADAVWRIFAPSGGVISPTDIAVEVDESEGSLKLKPIVAHNAILMTPHGSTPVLEMVTSLEAKGFVTRDIGTIAEHLFKNRRIVRWAFAKDPDSVVWCILDNGQLLGLTYHRRLDVWGWHKHTCPLGAGYADVAVIPNSSDDNTDDVYFLINRGTVGSPNYYIEQLNRRITPQEAAYGLSASGTPYDYKFLDSALTLDNPLTITNISQANPAVVDITAHGLSNGDFVRIQNVTGMTEVNNVVYKVANKTANDFELNDEDDNDVDSTGFTAYISGGEAREMVTVLTGFDHLEGETVTAIADGAAREGLTVSSGTITLPQSASFAHGGIPYTSEAETLDIEAIFQSGGTQGRNKAISSVDIYFIDSRNCKVYASDRPTHERTIEFEDESSGDAPPPLFDGIKNVGVASDYGKEVRLVFKQDKPYPIHIRRAILDVDYAG
jgi:hypothetical protein